MSVVLEMMCKGCSNNLCAEHQEKTIRIDQITGLQIEVRCICDNYHIKMKSNIESNNLLNDVVCKKGVE